MHILSCHLSLDLSSHDKSPWKRQEFSLGDLKMLSRSNRGFSSIIKPCWSRFICLMYDKINYISNVNDCRRMLFTKKCKTAVNIPPARDARLNTLKGHYTWLDKIVTNMLWYILFCAISLIVFIFQTKSQLLYTLRLYLHSYALIRRC